MSVFNLAVAMFLLNKVVQIASLYFILFWIQASDFVSEISFLQANILGVEISRDVLIEICVIEDYR